MPLIKKPQKNDVLESCSGKICKLIANAWIHTRYPNNFRNIYKKFKKKTHHLTVIGSFQMWLDSYISHVFSIFKEG